MTFIQEQISGFTPKIPDNLFSFYFLKKFLDFSFSLLSSYYLYASDNTTSRNIGGTDAWAVLPPQILGLPSSSLPKSPPMIGLLHCTIWYTIVHTCTYIHIYNPIYIHAYIITLINTCMNTFLNLYTSMLASKCI